MTFKITGSKGYHMTFPNGYTVSVQFGAGNYCVNRNESIMRFGRDGKDVSSADAEVAVWGKDSNKMLDTFPHNDGSDVVVGWLTPMQVLDVLNWAAQQTTTKG